MVEYAEHLVVIISLYIPCGANTSENEHLLKTRLKLVKTAQQYVRQLKAKKVEILIGGDFNRHDQLWGGSKISETPE